MLKSLPFLLAFFHRFLIISWSQLRCPKNQITPAKHPNSFGFQVKGRLTSLWVAGVGFESKHVSETSLGHAENGSRRAKKTPRRPKTTQEGPRRPKWGPSGDQAGAKWGPSGDQVGTNCDQVGATWDHVGTNGDQLDPSGDHTGPSEDPKQKC